MLAQQWLEQAPHGRCPEIRLPGMPVSAYRSKTVPQLMRLQHLVSSLSIPSLQRACFVTHPVPCAPQALQNHCRFLACRSSGRFEIVLDASCSSRDLDCMLTNRVNTHGPAHACGRKRKTGSNIGELARLRRLMREEVLVDRCIVFSTVSSLALKEPTPM